MSDIEVLSESDEAERQLRLRLKGPFPGTPDELKKFVSPLCRNGGHEGLDLTKHWCKGGITWMGKIFYCRCACHTSFREQEPGTDFYDFRDIDNHDPMRKTLTEELREFALKNESTISSSRKTTGINTETSDPNAITDSGRRQKGSLEAQVHTTCENYMKGDLVLGDDEPILTTKIIAEEIASVFGCKEPSTGAIQAVLDRWETIGFAYVHRKPVGFVMFTAAGLKHGLAAMKERGKK